MQVMCNDAIRKRVQKVRKEMLENRSTADEIKDKLEGLSLGRLWCVKRESTQQFGKIEDLKIKESMTMACL